MAVAVVPSIKTRYAGQLREKLVQQVRLLGDHLNTTNLHQAVGAVGVRDLV